MIKATALAFIVAALLLTYSRGALIAFAGQLALFGFVFWRRINWKFLIKVAIVAVTGLVIFVAANMAREENHEVIDVEERVQFDNEEDLTSINERQDFWIGSLELIKENPWYGSGPFSFRYAYQPLQKNFLAIADHPHNLFLKIAVENGQLALAAFVLFLLAFLLRLNKKFKRLSDVDKALVSGLFIAIAGGFAHNLIDYNLNFFANIFLLFLFLTVIRSKLVVEEKSKRPQWSALFIAFVIAVVAFFEGLILIGAEIGNDDELRFSLFPRAYNVIHAEEAIADSDFDAALHLLNKEQLLSPINDRTHYLRALVYCNEDFVDYDLIACRNNIAMALGLNDMNYWEYYLLYLQAFGSEVSAEFIENTLDQLSEYRYLVDQNVHFTAYTENVELAAEVMVLVAEHLSSEEAEDLIMKSESMLKRAEEIRASKNY